MLPAFSKLGAQIVQSEQKNLTSMCVYLHSLKITAHATISGCAGTCASQCTFDGRLYSSLAGAGGQRAVVLDDNVLCNSEDPYRKKENVLVHEYAHTIKLYCLPETLKSAVSCFQLTNIQYSLGCFHQLAHPVERGSMKRIKILQPTAETSLLVGLMRYCGRVES